MSTPSVKSAPARSGATTPWRMLAVSLANFVAIIWIALCLAYAATTIGIAHLWQLPPAELGLFVLGTLSIPGMIWIWLGHRTRLATMDKAARAMARQFRDFSKFSSAEREEVLATAEASRRESLSLFEAAQASLAALGQLQGKLTEATGALVVATRDTSRQLGYAGKIMDERVQKVGTLNEKFQTSAGDLHKRTSDSVTAMGIVLDRVDKSQTAWGERAAQLDQVADNTVTRLHNSGEAIQVTVASLGDAAALLEARRGQIQRTGEDLVKELDGIDERIASGTARVDESLAGLDEAGAELVARISALDGIGCSHSDTLADTAARIGSTANHVAGVISGNIEQITTLSDTAKTRLEEAAGRVTSVFDGVRQIFSDAANDAGRLATLGEQMARHRGEMESTLSQIFDRLDHLSSRFQGQIGSAGEVEHAIGLAAHHIEEALARIRSEQELAGREIESFGERSHGLSLRLEGLRAAAVNGVSDLIGEADRLQSRSEVLTDELKGQAIAFGEAITRADGIAAIVKTTGGMIEQAVTSASEASRVIRGEFEAMGHAMDTQSGALQQKAGTAVETLDQSRARMEESIMHIGAILASLDGKAGDINFTVSTSISRLGELTHGLERAREEVLGSTDRVASHIDGVAQTLRGSADTLWQSAHLVTEASNHAAGIGTQLGEVGDGLRDRVVEISRVAAEATETLRASTDGLAQSADLTREQLGQIAQQVRHENEAIAGTLGRIASVEIALRGAGAMVAEIAGKAETSVEAARGELHAMGREIALQSKVLADTSGSNGLILGRTRDEMESVVERVQSAFGDLNQKAGEINFVVSTAVNRLGELSRGLENAQATIDGATDGASGRMSDAATAMRAEFDGVNEVANRALQRLEHTLTAIAATSATVDNETQTIEQRLAATFRTAEAGGTAFADRIGGVLDRFETAERTLTDGQARLAQGAEDATAHFGKLARELAADGSELGNAAVVTGERIIGASALVEQRLESINAIADQVKAALATFAADLGSLGDRSGVVTQQLADRGEVLRDNIVQIVRTAETTAESLKAPTATLLAGTIEIADAAGRSRTEIARATAELRREGTAIAETTAESRALTAQVAALLGERALELAQAARTVAAETVTMRDTNARNQRDLFLSAAKTVLDALSAMAVDLSRVLDADLPEELRIELVRGDIPGFVRRLAVSRDRIATPKLRAKFATDSRFRSHVQAYLGQFESLLKDAAAIDQGAVLSATLVSSDIGKIYAFLSAAIDSDRDDMQQTG